MSSNQLHERKNFSTTFDYRLPIVFGILECSWRDLVEEDKKIVRNTRMLDPFNASNHEVDRQIGNDCSEVSA